jgi:hypothetical protein
MLGCCLLTQLLFQHVEHSAEPYSLLVLHIRDARDGPRRDTYGCNFMQNVHTEITVGPRLSRDANADAVCLAHPKLTVLA